MRVVAVFWFTLHSLFGQSVCCCAMAAALPTNQSEAESPPKRGSCCGNAVKESDAPQRGAPKKPCPSENCPCQRLKGEAPAMAAEASAAEISALVRSGFELLSAFEAVVHSGDSGQVFDSATSPDTSTQSLSSEVLLHTFHRLRC
jgi:hypothetical protein